MKPTSSELDELAHESIGCPNTKGAASTVPQLAALMRLYEGFTAAYGCKRLLYFEGYEDIRPASAREKQLKGWRREKKLNLIRTSILSSKTLHRPGDGR
jgi:hypothetical protein